MSKKQSRKAISISGLAHAALREHIAGTTMTVSGVVEELIRGHLKMPARTPMNVSAPKPSLPEPAAGAEEAGVRFSVKSYPVKEGSVPRFEPAPMPVEPLKSKVSLSAKPVGTVPSTSRLDAIKAQNASRPPAEKTGLNVFRPQPTLTAPGKRLEVKRADEGQAKETPLSAVDAAAKIFTF